jgi:hypothetical protein
MAALMPAGLFGATGASSAESLHPAPLSWPGYVCPYARTPTRVPAGSESTTRPTAVFAPSMSVEPLASVRFIDPDASSTTSTDGVSAAACRRAERPT